MQVFKSISGRFFLISCLLLAFISTTSISYADDFNDGIRAYQVKNFQLAYEKWLPLAEKGHVLAQTLLGSLYTYGEGVERDDAMAAHWYLLAANSGSSQAQYNLGILYEKGWGVEQSNELARKWFRKAAENGRKDAASRLALLTELSHEPAQNLKANERQQSHRPVQDSATPPLMPFTTIDLEHAPQTANQNHAWLLKQPAHYYTVQLAASAERELLEDNLSRLPLEQDYSIVEIARNNTQWYALIYGSYPSAESARLARDKLPVDLSAWHPWIRPFGDIKTWRSLSGIERDVGINPDQQ